jgi:hypothetical protein
MTQHPALDFTIIEYLCNLWPPMHLKAQHVLLYFIELFGLFNSAVILSRFDSQVVEVGQ